MCPFSEMMIKGNKPYLILKYTSFTNYIIFLIYFQIYLSLK